MPQHDTELERSTCWERERKSAFRIDPECPSKVLRQVESDSDHIFTVVSAELESSVLSAWENCTDQTPRLCPWKVADRVRLGNVKSLMLLSMEPVAARVSFGAISTQLMSLEWATIPDVTLSFCTDNAPSTTFIFSFQTLTSLSELTVTSNLASLKKK